MPIEIHASSPAAATGSGTITSAAFNPPAGSLLVAVVAASTGGGTAISNSGTARTWTLRTTAPSGHSGVRIYTAPNPTALTSTTVTLTSSTGGMKIYVLTGAHPSSPIGAAGSGSSAVNALNVNGYTSTAAGSRGFCAAIDWNSTAAPTSTDDESAWYVGGFLPGMAITKAANTPASGSNVTFSLDGTGTGAADWGWVALEILGAALDATVDAATVEAVAEVPAPEVKTGQTAKPAVVEATAEVPAPEVSTGQTAKPAVVEATAEVPAPTVVAGSAELIEPDPVTAQAEVPAPAITAVQNATPAPAVVEAAAEVPAPTVTATFAATIPAAVVEAEALVPSPGVSVPILPGSLITADQQVEWGGTALWGAGTAFALREITGWDAKPKVDSLTQEEPNRHGAFAGSSYLQRRIVTVKLQLQSFVDPSQISGLVAQLRHDTRTLRDNTLWTLVIRGYTETLMAFGKCIDCTGVRDADWRDGHPEPVVTFECPDPRRYGLLQQSMVIDANASAPVSLVNGGDLYTSPIYRFTGPATDPMIVNETLGRVMAFDITLGAGEILVVDTQRGKAEIAGVDVENNLADTISVPLKEFYSEVGSNSLSYETTSGGDAGVEVLWRDAYE
ncbi:hypothetical protein HD597_010099 [Nonomuraea thailandensis]|uniref:Phage tail protein n=1 Tax=Nonomuraea thailandensis TaxID=1188745 RepID=A0A9X2GT30_9ACTN|nr:hypothetical protein [Nonomuraea thailandensis]MCP2363079.1 hypothetical protein [Nonomuraea thailandensis]